MRNRFLLFKAPFAVTVEEEEIDVTLADDEVLLHTEKSAVSAGTERLLYQGEFPKNLPLDANIKNMDGELVYPLRYGYAAVAHVADTGAGARQWMNRRVFVFAPHQEWHVARRSELFEVPSSLPSTQATLLANMETAVSLVTDAAPLVGERIAIVGAGLVGLLTLQLLKGFPAAEVAVIDTDDERRARAQAWGATGVSPILHRHGHFDLLFELSGKPELLNDCIDAAFFGGRIVVGSFYGNKSMPLALGGRFHRERLQLISSQVSRITGPSAGRIDKRRRLEFAARQLHQLPFKDLQTAVVPMREAAKIYTSLCEQPQKHLHWVIDYAA